MCFWTHLTVYLQKNKHQLHTENDIVRFNNVQKYNPNGQFLVQKSNIHTPSASVTNQHPDRSYPLQNSNSRPPNIEHIESSKSNCRKTKIQQKRWCILTHQPTTLHSMTPSHLFARTFSPSLLGKRDCPRQRLLSRSCLNTNRRI